MRRNVTIVFACVTAFGLLTADAAHSRSKRRGGGAPGVFDYYVLSLSWSPEHCATPAGQHDTTQCAEGRRFGFVVHGLWPQYERGYPEACAASSQVNDAVTQQMLPLMPSRQLIQHEWGQHGTCSGLDQDAYFATIRRARAGVNIPAEYTAPVAQVNVSPSEIKQEFVKANPGVNEDSVHVLCSSRFISEVRLCFTKDLMPRACGADVRDTCRADDAIMRPVR